MSDLVPEFPLAWRRWPAARQGGKRDAAIFAALVQGSWKPSAGELTRSLI